jgi:signal transduction histidine kinase
MHSGRIFLFLPRMKAYWLLTFLIFLLWHLPAQSQSLYTIEQLLRRLNTAQTDSARTHIVLELGDQYVQSGPRQALTHYVQAKTLSERSNYYSGISLSEFKIGTIYHFRFFDSQRAAYHYDIALSTAVNTRDTRIQSDLHYHKGLLMAQVHDTIIARNNLRESIRLARISGDSMLQAKTNMLLGDLSVEDSNRLSCYQASLLSVGPIAHQQPALLLQIWKKIADTFEKIGRRDSSEVYHQHIIRHFRADSTALLRDEHSVLLAAQSMIAMRQYRAAIQLIETRLYQFRYLKPDVQLYRPELLSNLSECYAALGDTELAYKHMRESAIAEQAEVSRTIEQNIQGYSMNLQTEADQRMTERALLQEQNRTYIAQLLLGIVLIVAALMGIALWYLYKSRKTAVEQRKRLADLNRTKNKILSILSHDLRSPLKALQNIIHLAQENLATADDIQIVSKQVSASVHNLQNNLDSLLLWAQSQQNELKAAPKSINLLEAIEEQVQMAQEWVLKKNIQLNIHTPKELWAYTDPIHAKLAIQNILTNAVKFTKPGGIIHIEAESIPSFNASRIIIQNDGLELNPQDIGMIFDPAVRYTRLGTDNEPGSGLGLSLTNELMTLNHGYIRLEHLADRRTQATLSFVAQLQAVPGT